MDENAIQQSDVDRLVQKGRRDERHTLVTGALLGAGLVGATLLFLAIVNSNVGQQEPIEEPKVE